MFQFHLGLLDTGGVDRGGSNMPDNQNVTIFQRHLGLARSTLQIDGQTHRQVRVSWSMSILVRPLKMEKIRFPGQAPPKLWWNVICSFWHGYLLSWDWITR